MNNVRLVDANALYNGAMKDEWFRFKERDNNGKESFAYSCAMQRLAEAPTIDAIPVVWLLKWIKTLQEGAYVRDIIHDWRKEQEAR